MKSINPYATFILNRIGLHLVIYIGIPFREITSICIKKVIFEESLLDFTKQISYGRFFFNCRLYTICFCNQKSLISLTTSRNFYLNFDEIPGEEKIALANFREI